MSWGARARAMDINPNGFESTVLGNEMKRFNMKDIDTFDHNPKGLSDFNTMKSRKNRKRPFGNFEIDDKVSKSQKKSNRFRYDDEDDSFERFGASPRLNRSSINGRNTQSTNNLTAFDKMRNTVDDNSISHKLLPRSKELFNGGAVEDHRDFRRHAFDSFDNDRTNTSINYRTPNKPKSSNFETKNGLSRLNDDRQSVTINEKFNEVQNYDPEEMVGSKNDKINPYLRKFIFRELDKIREDARKNNGNLSKTISDNEEFYNRRLDEMRKKMKGEIVPAQDVQRLVDHSVEKKILKMNLQDDTDRTKKGVAQTQNEVSSLANDSKMYHNQIKKLHNEVEQLRRELAQAEKKNAAEKKENDRKFKLLDKAINEVREESTANADSAVVQVEARMDKIEGKLKRDASKPKVIQASNVDKTKAIEPFLTSMRSDMENGFRKVNKRINGMEKENDRRINEVNILAGKSENLKKTQIKDLKDLYQKMNEMEDKIDETDMNISKKVNILNATPMAKATPEINAQAVEGRLERLETISVRHGKLFDDITPNMNSLVAQTNDLKVNAELQPKAIEKYSQEVTDDLRKEFDNKLDSLQRALENGNEAEFRDEVFKEIDGIKSAAIEDIKLLDENLKTLATDFNIFKDRFNPYDGPPFGGEPSMGRARSLNVIPPPPSEMNVVYPQYHPSRYDRIHQDHILDPRRIDNRPPPPSSIVYMNSQKSLDSRGGEFMSSAKRPASGSPNRYQTNSIYSTPSLGRQKKVRESTSPKPANEFTNHKNNGGSGHEINIYENPHVNRESSIKTRKSAYGDEFSLHEDSVNNELEYKSQKSQSANKNAYSYDSPMKKKTYPSNTTSKAKDRNQKINYSFDSQRK